MNIVCLDLEGVLVPEIWIEFAKESGISELEKTTRDEPDYDKKKLEYEQTENQFLKNAYDGFLHARENESFPIAGMDQMTLDFLLANLAIRFEEYETASRLVASLLSSKTTPARIKDKARDLKMIILEKLREQKANE